ncbi:altronate dehydratase (plasmid) [Pseudovibrio sp. FO-BEG1]|uniref:UxaA family hydrolase n=1 Tax=Pseudovibrio sp. (strain FO-BEG1) TaxID=911045 RepID=UPI000238C900|nr:altronate dehydratase family protein [Pseudovibrio sp. FO-BEG1]AEV39685.1 altronate dehydratase [Pseudovibrio sp. FO-BEG1]
MQIHRDDTVLVALKSFKKNEIIEGVSLLQDIPAGHKIARADIAEGEHVIKYGASIGRARSAIKCGEHIHSHNLKTGLGTDETYTYAGAPEQQERETKVPQILAFERANGDIGIRNDLWIVPLVGCVNGVAQAVARQFERSEELPEGTQVTVLAHPFGCSQLGDDHVNTRTILQNLVMHPNAGGVLVMGLGCENNTLTEFLENLEMSDQSRLRCMVAQETENEFETAYRHLQDLAGILSSDKRVPVGVDRLRIGLKCGGSDGFSGITANPLLGALSDWLCSRGGATVLTEVPEMFGAERILMKRAENQSVFADIVSLINDFKQYYIDHDQPIYENPSPGNKEGGITTLEEKSLGCTQKAGTSIITDVLRYQDRLSKNGLNLLEAPGNDGTAITSLAAAGCHMVLFTTGRGNPLGTVVPTVKVASNTELADRKKHWIDFSAGTLIHDDTSLDELCTDFADYLMQVASGKQTLNEINRMQEIVIFKTGVTL